MRPTWLVEAGVYGDEATPLLREIRRQGMTADVVPHTALKKRTKPSIAGRSLGSGECVIGYGTFPFARQIQLHHDWTPGAWCSVENLDCGTYYAHFGRHLLNQQYEILPGVEAIRQQDRLFDEYDRDGRVFARPTSAHKLFVGRCIDRDSFATALAPTRYDPTTRVVVATPRAIGREWRLVVIDGVVVSGSQYAVNGEKAITPDCPPGVRAFAEFVLADVLWRPDPAFMLDVCESAGRLWLVELNSFSASWLYQCDLPAVVSTAGELAGRCWRER